MNTPSHALINLSLLLPVAPASPLFAGAIFVGSILPDLPMFVLYVWAKGIKRQPEGKIWSKTYWEPFWQNFTHGFHSIPLGLLGAVGVTMVWGDISHPFDSPWACLFFSAVLHDLGDLPVHHDDAHRHFLPFSRYRFISPFSYWDRRYHARWVSLVEKLLVLVATAFLWVPFQSWVIRTLLLAVNLLYWSSYCYRFFVRGCEQAQQKPLS